MLFAHISMVCAARAMALSCPAFTTCTVLGSGLIVSGDCPRRSGIAQPSLRHKRNLRRFFILALIRGNLVARPAMLFVVFFDADDEKENTASSVGEATPKSKLHLQSKGSRLFLPIIGDHLRRS